MSLENDIRIEYDGAYPNLCSGNLVVFTGEVRWEFPAYCMSSGGAVSFDEDWNEDVSEGSWSICGWPKGFPEGEKEAVIAAVNDSVSCGCCGGCV